MNEIERLELKIAKFLRAGVVFAGSVMAVGLCLSLIKNPNPFESLRKHSHIRFMDILEVSFMDSNWGSLISYVGLIILISLPVLRVLLTAILFLRQKEFILAGIAGLVLCGLILSFSLGIEL